MKVLASACEVIDCLPFHEAHISGRELTYFNSYKLSQMESS